MKWDDSHHYNSLRNFQDGVSFEISQYQISAHIYTEILSD